MQLSENPDLPVMLFHDLIKGVLLELLAVIARYFQQYRHGQDEHPSFERGIQKFPKIWNGAPAIANIIKALRDGLNLLSGVLLPRQDGQEIIWVRLLKLVEASENVSEPPKQRFYNFPFVMVDRGKLLISYLAVCEALDDEVLWPEHTRCFYVLFELNFLVCRHH